MKLFLLLIFFVKSINSANILAIFPIASASHNIVYRALTDALEERGHTLTIITANPRNNTENVVEIDFSFMYKVIAKLIDFNKWKEKSLDEVAMLGLWTDVFDDYFDEQFNHPIIKEMIKKKENFHYDLVILEFSGQIPWQGFATLFNAPVIGISSLDMIHTYHYDHGNVMNPILHPDFIFPFYDDLSFMQRARVLRYYLWYHLYYKGLYNQQFDKIIKRHMGTLSLPTDQLNSIAEVLLINVHPALDHVRPILPTTIQLGFLHIKEPKMIENEEIKNFLDASQKPIIYMSLGSMVKSSAMSEHSIEIFKNAFKSIENEFDVMWKWEMDEMSDKPRNVFINKWFPQADLLAHERVKIFISQGGQQSMEEAIDREVPLIVLPFASDQDSNARRIKKLGIGIELDIHTLTKESLIAAINEIKTGNYDKNIKNLKEIVNDEPMKPVEKAVWWTEYVIRHGGTLHLDYQGRHVPFWKYLMLDFIAIAIIAWHIFIKTVKFLVCRLLKGKSEKKKIKKSKKQ